MKTLYKIFHRSILAPAFLLLPLLAFISCPSGNTPSITEEEPLTVYYSSDTVSDFTKQTLAAISTTSYERSARSADSEEENEAPMPDIFVLDGAKDITKPDYLSQEDWDLLLKTVIADKTILIDSPAQETQKFARFMTSFIELYKMYTPEAAGDFSRSGFSSTLKKLEEDPDADYEAIGVGGSQAYFVHAIDEEIEVILTEEETAYEEDETENESQNSSRSAEGSTSQTVNSSGIDYQALSQKAASQFASWLSEKKDASAPLPRSLQKELLARGVEDSLNDIKNAQSFIHNFTATYKCDNTEVYDGRYNNVSERVEVITDVWAACDIPNQTDYYLVRNSVTCNNEMLNWKQQKEYVTVEGDKYPLIAVFGPPYMDSVTIQSHLPNGILRQADCSPKNNISGSRDFSITSGFQIGTTAGLAYRGPYAGVKGIYTCTETTTFSIPDIKINLYFPDKENCKWTYCTPKLEWKKKYEPCPVPVEIARTAATFDSFSLYTIPSTGSNSGGNSDGTIDLETKVNVKLNMLEKRLDFGTLYSFGCEIEKQWTHKVQRPNNACGEYIMFFESKDGSVLPDNLYDVMNQYISGWETPETYYAVGKENLDSVAAENFEAILAKIKKLQRVLKARGFRGTYTFVILNGEGESIKEEDITF